MMQHELNLTKATAFRFRAVFFGGNWTSVNLTDTLHAVDWQTAMLKTEVTNSIAELVFHIGYYVREVLKVLRGGPLVAHDRYSFDLPPIPGELEWKTLVEDTLDQARQFADEIERMPESRLAEDFHESKYGTYLRNIDGIIEHTHYHLGQILLLKKLSTGGILKAG